MENTTQEPELVNGSRQLAIEIQSQRALALANPRDEKKVLAACLGELAIAPEFAEEAYYSIPYKRRDQESGETVEELVEGLSVKASRAAARRWGNCAVASRIASETDEAIELEGVFADFETNVFIRRTVQVKKVYLAAKTKVMTPLKGTMLANAIQAGLSKAERNATLASLPEYLKERIFASAKLLVGSKDKGKKTDAERLDACYASFGKFGVEPARVMAYVRSALKGKTTDEIIGTMVGVYTALRDNQAKVEDTFPIETKPEKEGPVKLKDILPGEKKDGELL